MNAVSVNNRLFSLTERFNADGASLLASVVGCPRSGVHFWTSRSSSSRSAGSVATSRRLTCPVHDATHDGRSAATGDRRLDRVADDGRT